MNLDKERILVNNDLFEDKEWLPASLKEPVLFKPIKQIGSAVPNLKPTLC